MAAYIKKLQDRQGNDVLPITTDNAVIMSNNVSLFNTMSGVVFHQIYDQGTPLSTPLMDPLVVEALNDIGISVKDKRFGAVGDGVADDTNAIIAALEYANSIPAGMWETGGDTEDIERKRVPVFFPAGRYRTTRTIPIRFARVSIFGQTNDTEGSGDCIIVADHDGDVFNCDSNYFAFYESFRYIRIEKTIAHYGKGHGISITGTEWTEGYSFIGVGITACDDGIRLAINSASIACVWVEKCSLSNNFGYGFHCVNHITIGKIEKNMITQNGTGGIYTAGKGIAILNNNLEGQPNPLTIAGTNNEGIFIENNYFEGTWEGEALINLSICHGFTIKHNEFTSNIMVPAVKLTLCSDGEVDFPPPILRNCYNVYSPSCEIPHSSELFSNSINLSTIPIPGYGADNSNIHIFGDDESSTIIGGKRYKAAFIDNATKRIYTSPTMTSFGNGDSVVFAYVIKYTTTLPEGARVVVSAHNTATDVYDSMGDNEAYFDLPSGKIQLGESILYYGGFKTPVGNYYDDIQLSIYPWTSIWDPGYGAYLTKVVAFVTSTGTFNLFNPLMFLNDYLYTTRPENPQKGESIFDTNLNRPIWWDSTKWVDAGGTGGVSTAKAVTIEDSENLINAINVEDALQGFAKQLGLSIIDYPRLAPEAHDSARIQRAVDANPNKVIKFPDGIYEIDTPITITNQASLELSKDAIFKAVADMSYMVDWDGGGENIFPEYSMHITGGVFDGDARAGGLTLGNIHHFLCENTWYKDCKVGLNIGKPTDYKSYEGIFSNLYFRNTVGISNSTGIQHLQKGDHHFSDIVIVDYTIGIVNNGWSNRFFRCHYWFTDILPDKASSVAFQTAGTDGVWTDCYADTSHTGWYVLGDTRIVNGSGAHATNYGGTNHVTIRMPYDVRLTLIGGRFSGDNSTDSFFEGVLSDNITIEEVKYVGLKKCVYPNSSYTLNTANTTKTEFLTIKIPVNAISVNMNVELNIQSNYGSAVFDVVLEKTNINVFCDNVDFYKHYKVIKTSDVNNFYYHFYQDGDFAGTGTLIFSIRHKNGSVVNTDGISLSTKYLTYTVINVGVEGAAQQVDFISGTEVLINQVKSLSTEKIKIGKFYIWDDGAGHLKWKASEPASLSDGTNLV